MENWKMYAKAIVGALVAGLGALGTALTDEVITQPEWVLVATAFLTALGVVWAVPNEASDAGSFKTKEVDPAP